MMDEKGRKDSRGTILSHPPQPSRHPTMLKTPNSILSSSKGPRKASTSTSASRGLMRQGSTITNLNNEMIRSLEDLKVKRDELQRHIEADEDDKTRLQQDIQVLSEKLSRVNEQLARKLISRSEFDKAIKYAEAAYAKLIESSQNIVMQVKEAANKFKHSIVIEDNTSISTAVPEVKAPVSSGKKK